MTTQPTEPYPITITATKALNLVKLLATCHTLEACTANDRALALTLLKNKLNLILEEASRGAGQAK